MLQKLDEDPKVNIQLYSVRTTLKNVPNRKTPVYNGIHGFCIFFLNHFYLRQTDYRNK